MKESMIDNKKSKNRTTHVFFRLIACWLIVGSLICSAATQEVKQTSDGEVSPSSQQEEAPASNNAIISSEVPYASPHEVKSTSSSSDTSDGKKISSDANATNKDSSNPEINTNGVISKDPSIVPPESTPADNATSAPLPMDPNEGSMTDTSEEESAPVNSTESIEKKKYEIKVRYNEVRTKVEKEEAIAALRQAADKSTTTEGQRQTLKAYYELLFKRMKQIDPSLAERCDVMQAAYLRRLEQTALEPTIPLHLPLEVKTNSTNPPQGAVSSRKEKVHKKISTSNITQ